MGILSGNNRAYFHNLVLQVFPK